MTTQSNPELGGYKHDYIAIPYMAGALGQSIMKVPKALAPSSPQEMHSRIAISHDEALR